MRTKRETSCPHNIVETPYAVFKRKAILSQFVDSIWWKNLLCLYGSLFVLRGNHHNNHSSTQYSSSIFIILIFEFQWYPTEFVIVVVGRRRLVFIFIETSSGSCSHNSNAIGIPFGRVPIPKSSLVICGSS